MGKNPKHNFLTELNYYMLKIIFNDSHKFNIDWMWKEHFSSEIFDSYKQQQCSYKRWPNSILSFPLDKMRRHKSHQKKKIRQLLQTLIQFVVMTKLNDNVNKNLCN